MRGDVPFWHLATLFKKGKKNVFWHFPIRLKRSFVQANDRMANCMLWVFTSLASLRVLTKIEIIQNDHYKPTFCIWSIPQFRLVSTPIQYDKVWHTSNSSNTPFTCDYKCTLQWNISSVCVLQLTRSHPYLLQLILCISNGTLHGAVGTALI